MNLFKNPFSRKPTKQTAIEPYRTRPSVIDIPEILERIFFYTDDVTLRRTVVLVCRQWFYLNVNRHPRAVSYIYNVSQEQPEVVVSRLTGACRLHCFLQVDDLVRSPRVPGRLNIGYLIESSQDAYRKESRKRNRIAYAHKLKPTIYTFSPFREMVLDVDPYINGSLDTFPYPSTLTSITLQCRSSGSSSFNLSRILSRCPLLEFLTINSRLREKLCFSWNALTASHGELALRSFTLNHISIEQSRLEHILTSSPHLRVLKLIAMIDFDLPALLRHIRTLPLDLETLHLSAYERPLPQELQQQIFEVCPVTSDWNLWAADMSPSLLLELEAHTPCLTTLELHWRRKGSIVGDEKSPDNIISASRLLFTYLCNSSHAIHLTTLKAGVLHHDMDIYRRGRYSNHNKLAVDSLPPSLKETLTCSGIWRCRNLRVLHINLRDPTGSMKRRLQSRIVYGYISKVVPHLEVLEIFYPYYNTAEGAFISGLQPFHRIPMVLDGGFCLLGRLRQLRRLSVVSAGGKSATSCKEMDLNWMVPSGRSGDKFRVMRRLEVESWQHQQFIEEQWYQEQDQEQQRQDDSISGKDGGSLDLELRGQLRNLGLLSEVAEMISKIDTGSIVPFPSLRGLSFEHPMLRAPEKELKELFSDRT